VERDYRLRTARDVPGAIYLQGGTEHTHGLSSSLISNIAVRCGEIVESIANDPVFGPSRRRTVGSSSTS
jgi:L-ornithine N5-oxygenase